MLASQASTADCQCFNFNQNLATWLCATVHRPYSSGWRMQPRSLDCGASARPLPVRTCHFVTAVGRRGWSSVSDVCYPSCCDIAAAMFRASPNCGDTDSVAYLRSLHRLASLSDVVDVVQPSTSVAFFVVRCKGFCCHLYASGVTWPAETLSCVTIQVVNKHEKTHSFVHRYICTYIHTHIHTCTYLCMYASGLLPPCDLSPTCEDVHLCSC